MSDDMNFPFPRIVEMFGEPQFSGFTAETCGNCQATANVIAHNPGWFCECEHFNVQSWSDSRIPWEDPTYGPTQATIMYAAKQAWRSK